MHIPDYSRSCQRIVMKFFLEGGTTTPLDFGRDPDRNPDPGNL